MGWNEKNPQDQIQYNNFLFLNGKNILNNNNKDMPKIQTTKRIVEFNLSIFILIVIFGIFKCIEQME